MATATTTGHPRGLLTLFFTEMWERFSYYGLRALLILYLTQETIGANPGLGISNENAGAIYGLYTGLVYLLGLPGGWVADQLWGQRKAVMVGGCIIAAGHFIMAVPSQDTVFLGLILVAVGTGLLKPSISSVVADLYPEGGARRDAGFSIFYMGINIGAFAGPLVCGWLGEDINWHWGFAAAGVGMVLGLIQFRLGYGRLGDAGALRSTRTPEQRASTSRWFFAGCAFVAAAAVFFGLLVNQGVLPIPLTDILGGLGVLIIVVVLLFFARVLLFGGHNRQERDRVKAIFWFFFLAVFFWAGFEQAGSSLNIFARDLTDRTLGSWSYPATWLQSVNAFFIVVLAPVFGSLWVWLANRNANPSIPTKFALGLMLLAAGFFVISWGASNATTAAPAAAYWLVVMYFLHTVGELVLSPVGLSAMTKLAPANRVGQMMGIWFVATSVGTMFAGLVAGRLGSVAFSSLFAWVATVAGLVGMLALFASRRVKQLMGDVV